MFLEGDECSGVFVLRCGRVKLSVSQTGGRSVFVDIAEPGDIVGLASVIDGSPYEATAEALEQCDAEFVGRDELLRGLTAESGLSMHALRQLSRSYLNLRDTLVSLSVSDPVIVRPRSAVRKLGAERQLLSAGEARQPFHTPTDRRNDRHTRRNGHACLREMRTRGLATLKNGGIVLRIASG